MRRHSSATKIVDLFFCVLSFSSVFCYVLFVSTGFLRETTGDGQTRTKIREIQRTQMATSVHPTVNRTYDGQTLTKIWWIQEPKAICVSTGIPADMMVDGHTQNHVLFVSTGISIQITGNRQTLTKIWWSQNTQIAHLFCPSFRASNHGRTDSDENEVDSNKSLLFPPEFR